MQTQTNPFEFRYKNTINRFSPERVGYIIEHFHEIKVEEKMLLIQLINHILGIMIERQASDVEIGGFGAQACVWMRIFGKKERVNDLPQFSEDEVQHLSFLY